MKNHRSFQFRIPHSTFHIPKRILVVMPNWFGETLFATPFLRALRGGLPQSFIAALGVPRAQAILAHNPQVDELVLYDEQAAHGTWRGRRALARLLRAKRFDTAVILRRSLTRTLLLAWAGIPRRIGFANLKSGWLLTHRVQPPKAPIHKAHAYLRLLAPLGLREQPGSYAYYPSEEERAQARQLLHAKGLLNGNPLVVLHPGANWAHKRWGVERFIELANRLIRRHPVSLVLTGGPDDLSLIGPMLPRLMTRPVVLAGQTTLRQLAAVLEHAGLVVSNDTGVVHVAAALGRPVVALYGPTSPAITGPLGDATRTVVIHHPDCCPRIPCLHPDHPKYPGMDAISVEEVYVAACQMLESGKLKVESGKT